jgi:hypothetical protein
MVALRCAPVTEGGVSAVFGLASRVLWFSPRSGLALLARLVVHPEPVCRGSREGRQLGWEVGSLTNVAAPPRLHLRGDGTEHWEAVRDADSRGAVPAQHHEHRSEHRPRKSHGKEGVSGSSPEEGFARAPETGLCCGGNASLNALHSAPLAINSLWLGRIREFGGAFAMRAEVSPRTEGSVARRRRGCDRACSARSVGLVLRSRSASRSRGVQKLGRWLASMPEGVIGDGRDSVGIPSFGGSRWSCRSFMSSLAGCSSWSCCSCAATVRRSWRFSSCATSWRSCDGRRGGRSSRRLTVSC